jgi:zinc transporter ZupT
MDKLLPFVFATEPTESSSAVFWTKIGFIVISFSEAIIAGLIPTWSPKCRESPKILGIANSFAAGVFLAIAFMHIAPEMIEEWNEMEAEKGVTKIFPLPEILIFAGYTLILIIDKVLFDTHALFDHDHDGEGHDHNDPAELKLEVNMKASIAKAERSRSDNQGPIDVRKSRIEEKEELEGAMKSYLNPHDRFATRMKASMNKGSSAAVGGNAEQDNLFVDSTNVALTSENCK